MPEKVRLTQTYKMRCVHKLPFPELLPDRFGDHGHHYLIEVTIEDSIHQESGLSVDRKYMNGIVEQILIAPYDKSYLNDHFEHTTGEVLAQKFFDLLKDSELGPILNDVTVRETEKNSYYTCQKKKSI